MNTTVEICENEKEPPIRLPVEEDGLLSLSEVVKKFPGAAGLKYRPTANSVPRSLLLKNGKLHPPACGWGNIVYVALFPNTLSLAPPVPLFFEDEVCRVMKTKELQYGMVIENAEFYSDDDSDSDDSETLKEGFVKIAWYPKGEQEIVAEEKLVLADRSLMPGDVVSARKYGPDKVGYCRSIDVHSSVKIVGSEKVILDVKSQDLKQIEDFSTDLAAYYNGWVGMIKEVDLRITARSSNSVVYKFDTSVGSKFRDITDKRKKNSEFRRSDFYPGQVLVGNHSNLDSAEVVVGEHKKSTDAKSKRKAVRLTVEKVDVESLKFRWQCQAHADCDNEGVGKHEQPQLTVSGEEIQKVKMLNVFEPATVQLGDRNLYTWTGNEKTVSIEEWKEIEGIRLVPGVLSRDTQNGHRDVEMDGEEPKVETREESGEPLASSSEYEDVESDDNTSQASTSSSKKGKSKTNRGGSLLSTKVLRKRKLRRSIPKVDIVIPEPKPGDQLVVESLGTETRVTVVWQDGTIEPEILSRELYPVHYLDDQEFFPGDFVVGSRDDGHNTYEYGTVKRVDRAERTAVVSWFKLVTDGSTDSITLCSEVEVSAYDIRDHPDYKYRPGSCVIRISGDSSGESLKKAGQVLDNLPKGKVLVWWVDGSTSECDPQQLYRVGDYDSEAGELWDEHDSAEESEGSWSTESESELKLDLGAFLATGLTRLSRNMGFTKSTAIEALKNSSKLLGNLDKFWTYPQDDEEVKAAARDLVNIYKACRPMDNLLSTSYFSESVFGDLVEKVKNKKTIPIVPSVRFPSDPVDQYDIMPLLNEVFKTRDQGIRLSDPTSVVNKILEAVDLENEIDDIWGTVFTMSMPFVGHTFLRPIIAMVNQDVAKIMTALGIALNIDFQPWLALFKVEIDTITAVLRGLSVVSQRCVTEKRDITFEEIKNIFERDGVSREFLANFLVITETQVKLDFNKLNTVLKTLNEAIEQVVKPDEFSKVVKYYKKRLSVPTTSDCAEIISLVFALLCGLEWCLKRMPENSLGRHFPAENILEFLSSFVMPGSHRTNSEHVQHKRYLCTLAEDVMKRMAVGGEAPQSTCDKIDIKQYCLRLSATLQAQIKGIITELEKRFNPSVDCEVTVLNGALVSHESLGQNGEETAGDGVDPLQSGGTEHLDVEMGEEAVATSEDIQPLEKKGTYSVIECTPASHRFHSDTIQPKNPKAFLRAVREEIMLLRTSLPEGIHVRSFEDRSDLFSVMIEGPSSTPYEDGLFFFDFQLPANYPLAPPICHYYAYCKDRLNPNLYEEGKVCVSLLGTWNGRGSEVWNPGSNLLQVLVSIQGLILNSEPYYNEAGYERQRGSMQASENSRLYNEMVYLKMAQSMGKQISNPHECFKEEVVLRLRKNIPRFTERLKIWMVASSEAEGSNASISTTSPDFPLLPLSKGFSLAIQRWLSRLEEVSVSLVASPPISE